MVTSRFPAWSPMARCEATERFFSAGVGPTPVKAPIVECIGPESLSAPRAAAQSIAHFM